MQNLEEKICSWQQIGEITQPVMETVGGAREKFSFGIQFCD